MSVLAKSRASHVETRMGPAIRDAIESHPGLAGMALFVRFADSEDPNVIAQTDGAVVQAGPRYETHSASDKVFITLHELLHVSLAHPIRAKNLAARHHDFDRMTYNISTDAVINSALSLTLHRPIPDGLIELKTVLTNIGQWEENKTVEDAVAAWSSESLYYALRTHLRENPDKNLGDLCRDKNDASGAGDPSLCRLDPSPIGNANEREDHLREWQSRLKNGIGHMPGLMRRLARDLPEVKTPWERLLRDFLHRRCSRKRVTDWSRPSRRYCALEYDLRKREGINLPFQPGHQPGRSARIAVAVDTSGSIGEEMLNQFTAEIATIMARTNSTIRLIVCDAEVHQTEDLKGYKGQQKIRHFTYTGGGGTDFKPAIAAAVDFKPDVLVFLTDLMGDAGEPPRFPVLWACIGKTEAPWGTRIELD